MSHIAHELRRPWGAGTLSLAFDTAERSIVAAFEHEGVIHGPIKILELPSSYDAPEKIKRAVKETLSMFDADMGGDEYFTSMFGPEAGELAYGAYRKTAEAARKNLTRSDAVRIAESMIEDFYIEARPGQTPFDNWALVNRLNAKTFGLFNSVDQIMRILEQADDNVRQKRSR